MNIKRAVYLARRTWFWWRHQGQLEKLRDTEEFFRYVDRVRHKFLVFNKYRNDSASKREEFRLVLDALAITLPGTAFMDIGPGFGDSLDIAHEQGAAVVEFVEIDPFFFRYNQLKGYARGYRLDHLKRLRALEGGRYDLIWTKGAIAVDHFASRRPSALAGWLDQLERLAAPAGVIVVCPEWLRDRDDRRLLDVRANLFSDFLLRRGFAMMSPIAGHNSDPQYPVTFCKKKLAAP